MATAKKPELDHEFTPYPARLEHLDGVCCECGDYHDERRSPTPRDPFEVRLANLAIADTLMPDSFGVPFPEPHWSSKLRKMVEAVFDAGFDAGFSESGEGWNGKYPHSWSTEQRERLIEAQHKALEAYLKDAWEGLYNSVESAGLKWRDHDD